MPIYLTQGGAGGGTVDAVARASAASAVADLATANAEIDALEIAVALSSEQLSSGPSVQTLQDSGRGTGGVEQYSVTTSASFNAVNFNPYSINASLGASHKFSHNNASGGGTGPVLDPMVISLLAAMGRTGSSIRYGTEFYIFESVVSAGATAGLTTFNGSSYYLAMKGTSALVGSDTFATNAAWVYSTTDDDIMIRTVGGSRPKIYLNGVDQNAAFVSLPAGWNHICWQIGASTGYTTSLSVYSKAGLSVWGALPVFSRNLRQLPVHKAPVPFL